MNLSTQDKDNSNLYPTMEQQLAEIDEQERQSNARAETAKADETPEEEVQRLLRHDITRRGYQEARRKTREGKLPPGSRVFWSISPYDIRPELVAERDKLAAIDTEWIKLGLPLHHANGRQEVVINSPVKRWLSPEEIIKGARLAVSYASTRDISIQKFTESEGKRYGSESQANAWDEYELWSFLNSTVAGRSGTQYYSGNELNIEDDLWA